MVSSSIQPWFQRTRVQTMCSRVTSIAWKPWGRYVKLWRWHPLQWRPQSIELVIGSKRKLQMWSQHKKKSTWTAYRRADGGVLSKPLEPRWLYTEIPNMAMQDLVFDLDFFLLLPIIFVLSPFFKTVWRILRIGEMGFAFWDGYGSTETSGRRLWIKSDVFEVQLTGGKVSMRILIVNLSEYRLT